MSREAQLKYELESDARAQAEKLRVLLTESTSGDPNLPRAHALLVQMLSDVRQRIQDIADVKTRGMGGKYKNWLRALPLDVAAVIAIRTCIKVCFTREKHAVLQELAYEVGKLWELEVRIQQASAVNPMYMQKISEQLKEHATRDQAHIRKLYNVAINRVFKGEIDLSLTKAEIIQIGKFGVDACFAAGLLDMERGTNRNGTSVQYSLATEVEEYLMGYDQSDVRSIISKEDTKMLCPPDPWTTLLDGGYLSLRRKAQMPLMGYRKIRKALREQVVHEFTAEKMPQIFSCANYLQSTAFEIHQPTRDAILRTWATGGNALGVPSKAPPKKPEFPLPETFSKADATPEELAIFQRWKRHCGVYYENLRTWKGKVLEISGFFKSSKDQHAPMWFPVYFDTRGRWYYRGMPNPQGSDMSKACLHFADQKPLGERGLFWLKVHIANSLGFDKARFADRARWVEQRWKALEAALDAPEDAREVWGTDAPWCAFSAAWELRRALASPNPREYLCGVPVAMDATCSGLQHFSALLRDPVGGRYVNLTDPNGSGPKEDIYGQVSNVALQYMQRDLESDDPVIRQMAEFWISVGIPRSMAKKPVMTYVYGATLAGAAQHIEDMFEYEIAPEKNLAWPNPLASFDYSMYAAKKLFAGIASTVPAAAAAMQWLKSVAREQPSGKRMQWRTPTGFLVQHDYQDYTEKRIAVQSCGVSIITVRDWGEGTQPHAMVNAISPNFVHALDASHLTMVANRMHDAGMQLVAVHDSFGTHPCDVEGMHKIIREELVNLYKRPNLMAEFLWEVGGAGETPIRGTLNLDDILSSEFVFC